MSVSLAFISTYVFNVAFSGWAIVIVYGVCVSRRLLVLNITFVFLLTLNFVFFNYVSGSGLTQQRSNVGGSVTDTTARLLSITERLVRGSLAASSLVSYQRSWSLFREFQEAVGRTELSLPLGDSIIALFVAFLVDKGFAASTIKTHLSAIAFSHKILNLYFPSKNFLVEKMLRAVQVGRPTRDSRLPITLPILLDILDRVSSRVSGVYERALFSAMCSTAFYAFMRSGEVCGSDNTVQFHSLLLDPFLAFAIITFHKFKHMNATTGWPIRIMAKPLLRHCPVQILLTYVQLRGSLPGPLFCSKEGRPVTRDWFTHNLQECLRDLAIDQSRIKLHSFRIGATTTALLSGKSHDEICMLGRWSSKAFKRYIRVSGLNSL